jgi:hypothetical protein
MDFLRVLDYLQVISFFMRLYISLSSTVVGQKSESTDQRNHLIDMLPFLVFERSLKGLFNHLS